MKKKQAQFSGRKQWWVFLAVVSLAISFIIAGSCKKKNTEEQNPTPDPGKEYDLSLFVNTILRAVHNSYSGNINGYRGGITQQLDAGLRFIEYDIRHEGGTFVIGHNHAGDAVDTTHGNPHSYNLSLWLHKLAKWCRENITTEPVILAFDMKETFNQGELVNLHDLVYDSLHEKLFPAHAYYPNIKRDSLANRIMVVLSGDYESRKTYAGFHGDSAILFVEFQAGNDDLAYEPFYATSAHGNCQWAKDWRATESKLIRLWEVTNDGCKDPSPNLPATNTPYFGWYARYCNEIQPFPKFAFKTIDWKGELTHQEGLTPDVAINNSGYVVEVHQSQNYINELWYNTGRIAADGVSVQWFNGVSSDDRNYDRGYDPSVAINDQGVVVEIHKSDNDDDDLWYNVGVLNTLSGKINWHHKEKHDKGHNPTISLNQNNYLVEVHKSNHDDHNLWYNVGKIKGDYKIVWCPMEDYRKYSSGRNPAVSLSGNTIFEAHNSSTDMLWCTIGYLDTNQQKVIWKAPNGDLLCPLPIDQEYSLLPTIAYNAKGAFEAHLSGSTIWWRTGHINNTVMVLGPTEKLTQNLHGAFSKISLDFNDKGQGIIFYQDESMLTPRLYYIVAKVK